MLCAVTPVEARAQDGEPSGTKRALIVAIGSYEDEYRYVESEDRFTGYQPINSVNDTALVAGALRRQGFDAIDLLVNEEATKARIVASLKELARTSQPGDVVAIHVSSHGQQITDDDGDEPDGYDEILVPYDAPNDIGDGTHHLRDDDLGRYVAQIRRSVAPGGNVLVTIDACHSGSVTRGSMPVRSGGEPLGPPAETASRPTTRGAGDDTDDSGSGLFENASSTSTRGQATSETPDLAPYVLLTAASHDELDHETYDRVSKKRVGPLSLALNRTLDDLGPGATYRRLYEAVRAHMATTVPRQTPQVEGSVDTELFSGQSVEQTPYYKVRRVGDDGRVILRGGSLLGLTESSTVAFFPPGTRSPDDGTALAHGTIQATTPFESAVSIDSTATDSPTTDSPTTVADSVLSTAWAFLTWRAMGDRRVSVQLDATLGDPVRAALTDTLSNMGIVQLRPDSAEVVVRASASARGGSAAAQIVSRHDGAVLHEAQTGSPEALVSEVVSRIDTYARSVYLQDLDLTNPKLDVDLEVLPARLRFDDFGYCDPQRSEILSQETHRTPGGALRYADGDTYLLRVTNDGAEAAYVTILSLMPDGSINQLYPDPEAASDNVIQPGDTYLVPYCYEVGKPYGTEILKLFATDQPVRFGPVLQTRSADAGNAGPLERFLAATYAASDQYASMTRSGRVGAPPKAATTVEVPLEIVPAK